MSTPKRWEVVHWKLDQPLRTLNVSSDAAGIYLVFWCNEIPLGNVMVASFELPLNAADLQRKASRAIAPAVGNYSLASGFRAPLPIPREKLPSDPPPDLTTLMALERPLANLTAKDKSFTPQEASVSVIVCTRNRPESLKNCLGALLKLEPAPFEIIVVDNAPQDTATRDTVTQFDGVIHLPEPAPGLSHARNSGIARSSGDIVAFTDDDVHVHPRWVERIRETLAQQNACGMTGLVLPAELETESQVRFETDLGGFNRGYRPIVFDSFFLKSMLKRAVPVWAIGAGANMAFRREVFTRIGLFDSRLGAGAAGCSEDSELWYRMLVAGMRIIYDPRAVVLHSHRIERRALINQTKQYMRGHVVALLVQFEKHGHVGNLRRLFAELPRHYWKEVKRGRLRRDWSLFLSQCVGCVWGLATYLRLLACWPLHAHARKISAAHPASQ